jgi:hypothetical protein
MQNAKDSFYMALRTRLAVISPERTILLRGAVRPGIIVEESEARFSKLPDDVYILRWLGLDINTRSYPVLEAGLCEILYQTYGTQSYGGLDRGRSLHKMDMELTKIISPFYTLKYNYTTTSPTAMLTNVFWNTPIFTPLVIQQDRLGRSVKVMVYSYQEEEE